MNNPLFARFFDRIAAKDEERGQAQLRDELLAGLAGSVIEVGVGNGLNLAHYPAQVSDLLAVEPEEYLRARAAEAAQRAPVAVRVVDGLASDLPADDASCDAVVVSGVLCSVPDQPSALAEFWRVLRPGGELRFYEHVRAETPIRRLVQQAADLVWPRMMGGCHPNRDTLAAIVAAGYSVDSCRRLTFPPSARLSPVATRILGIARKASG